MGYRFIDAKPTRLDFQDRRGPPSDAAAGRRDAAAAAAAASTPNAADTQSGSISVIVTHFYRVFFHFFFNQIQIIRQSVSTMSED